MTTTEDRERTRNQLKELARIARDVAPDSSGYVDLAAFAAKEGGWADAALRGPGSRRSEPPKIDRLDAESMRPVAMESLLDLDAPAAAAAKSARMQRAFIVASSVCIAGLAVAAIVLALRPVGAAPRPHTVAAAPVATATGTAVAAPAVDGVFAPALTPAPDTLKSPAPSVAADTLPAAVPPSTTKHAGTRKLVAPSSGARLHTHSRPAATPKATAAKKSSPAGGGDSLMGAIQQSIGAK